MSLELQGLLNKIYDSENAALRVSGSGTSGAVVSSVATSETAASGASYVDLATPGPAVTLDVPASGKVLLVITAQQRSSAAAAYNYSSVAISGANTEAASDDEALVNGQGVTHEVRASFSRVITGLTPGSTTFTMKYRAAGGTSTFSKRRISVVPL